MKPICRSPTTHNPAFIRDTSPARRTSRRCILAGVWLAALLAPTAVGATCSVATINQRTVVTATVVLGLSEHCEATIPAFPAPFTCETELIGTRSGGSDSYHLYDTGMVDLAECVTGDDIAYCYADGAAPPSGITFQCVAEIHRSLLDLFPATAQSWCGCASLKQAGE
ncbi:hypothetical protein [Lysobacter capsici]|uniref:hypothetical protein n=1 Tax=Lysobacter capsici TaxID=435897 RepID=UPI00398D0983